MNHGAFKVVHYSILVYTLLGHYFATVYYAKGADSKMNRKKMAKCANKLLTILIPFATVMTIYVFEDSVQVVS